MKPVLWSFRRCPYAIRARLALASANVDVEHREILLRSKPDAFLSASPEGTVPVVEGAGKPLLHSLDIMIWALETNDPEQLLNQPPEANVLIEQANGPFKTALDRYKYHIRIADADPAHERALGLDFIKRLAGILGQSLWLFGPSPKLADLAILPFVRQFAHVDLAWFDRFKSSERFAGVMQKHPLWQAELAPERG